MRLILTLLFAAIAIIFIAGILAPSAKADSSRHCDTKLETQAHNQPEPKNWNGLYRLFKRFAACDDGAVGERFSADVAQLLSTQWTRLDTLEHLVAIDKSFEEFVLRHIDTTLDEDELLHLADNSRSRCSVEESRLCGLIHARAQDSLDKLREVSE